MREFEERPMMGTILLYRNKKEQNQGDHLYCQCHSRARPLSYLELSLVWPWLCHRWVKCLLQGIFSILFLCFLLPWTLNFAISMTSLLAMFEDGYYASSESSIHWSTYIQFIWLFLRISLFIPDSKATNDQIGFIDLQKRFLETLVDYRELFIIFASFLKLENPEMKERHLLLFFSNM